VGGGGGEREGEGVVKKMGAWTTGKGPKGRGRKKEASKEASGAECVWAVGLCLWGGTGEERTPWLAGWLPMESAGQGAYKRKGWWRMYCRVVRMCISIYLPFLPPARNATPRAAREQ
jgi:hypothetical protein